MRKTDVVQWVAGECQTVINDATYVTTSTPADHVGDADDRAEYPYPFVGIRRLSSESQSQGMGNGNLAVHEIRYTNNVADAIVYEKESTLRVDLLPTADGDRLVRDKLSEDLEDHFSLFARESQSVPDDMDPPEVEEITPQGRVDDFVYTDGISVTIDYERHIVDDSITAAEDVNIDIDVEDPSDGSQADAFDDSFS